MNLGLLYAFTGEYFLATRHFRTALGIDDGAVPGNTAVGHYLRGIAFFELRQYPKATRAFHQCLILFRRKNIMEGKPELVAAAPWVSPLVGAEEEEKKEKNDKKKGGDGKEEEEEGMWTGFKHKIYEPTTAPSSDDSSKTSWKQWDLKRKDVEENMQAAITASGMRPKSSSVQDDNSTHAAAVHGIPGGALFWPLEEGHVQDPAHPKAKRPSSKPTKPVFPALAVEGKKDEAIGLGLQVPSRQAALTPIPDVKGPKWNEETQKWEDYLAPLPPLSRAPSRRPQQQLPGLDTSALRKNEVKANDGDGDGETTPKASASAATQQGERIVYADTGSLVSSSGSAVKHEAKVPSRKENQGAQYLERKTYSPSAYTTSPPTTVGSSFLSYYGNTPPQESGKHLLERARQSLRPAVPRGAESVEEKQRSAWLALNGLQDEEEDDDEDSFPLPTPTQPLFGTRDTTVAPASAAGSIPSVISKAEGSTLLPRRRTIIHRDSPYSGTETLSPSPRASSAEAEAAAPKRHNIPATAPSLEAARSTHSRLPTLSPIPQTPSPAISESQSRSPASAILSIYGSLTPPDTASTYRTDATVFTPSPSFPLSSHTPTKPPSATAAPTEPIATPPPTATTTTSTKPSHRPHPPRVFSASPLNNPSNKRPILPSKSIPRGLGIGIAGLAGPEPAIGLEEAMTVRARREEEEAERREVEKEYEEWMRSLEEGEEEGGKGEEEVGGGEILLPRVFEGFGVRKGGDVKGKEKEDKGGEKGEKQDGKQGDSDVEELGGEAKDTEEEWLRMAQAFHDSQIN